MTEIPLQALNAFLLRAKRVTYAANGPQSEPSRQGAHDYRYEEEEEGWLYLDSYFGSSLFGGEEAVWKHGEPVWIMNYCGHLIGEEGFRPDFLREALIRVPEDAPFRGPIEYQDGPYLYVNNFAGNTGWFFGREEIFHSGVSVYECVYHGGAIG